MGPSWCQALPLLLLVASLLVLSAAALHPTPPPPPLEPSAAEALLARMCDPRGAHHPAPPSWCHGLHLRRRGVEAEGHHRRNHPHHHRRPDPVPLPPPGRDGGGEEIDARYGVAKRLVPTGPNPLHN